MKSLDLYVLPIDDLQSSKAKKSSLHVNLHRSDLSSIGWNASYIHPEPHGF